MGFDKILPIWKRVLPFCGVQWAGKGSLTDLVKLSVSEYLSSDVEEAPSGAGERRERGEERRGVRGAEPEPRRSPNRDRPNTIHVSCVHSRL